MKTLSDRELDHRIAAQTKTIAQCKRKEGWTYEKMVEALNYLKQQRSLPREQRAKYADGSL